MREPLSPAEQASSLCCSTTTNTSQIVSFLLRYKHGIHVRERLVEVDRSDGTNIYAERAGESVGDGKTNGAYRLNVHGLLVLLQVAVRGEEKIYNWDLFVRKRKEMCLFNEKKHEQ